jgi:hypothetical protein
MTTAVSTTATLDLKENVMTEIADRVATARGAVAARREALSAAEAELRAAVADEQREAAAAGETHICPRRPEVGASVPEGSTPDYYAANAGLVTQARGCSFCGSMPPDEFMEAVRSGVEIDPTDKPYKAYIGGAGSGKFYYQHLSPEQMQEFVDLHNARTINWGAPGHPYVLPFFMRTGAPAGG